MTSSRLPRPPLSAHPLNPVTTSALRIGESDPERHPSTARVRFDNPDAAVGGSTPYSIPAFTCSRTAPSNAGPERPALTLTEAPTVVTGHKRKS